MQRTFQFEEDLPSLPVPSLQHTLTRYIESVKPHVSLAELERTTNIVKEFGNGIGKTLHETLLKKASTEKNWLENWWENSAYLSARGSKPFGGANVAFAILVMNVWPPKKGTQVERCALILWNVLKYWQSIHEETLPLETSRDKSIFSMHQYRSMFSSSVVPGIEMDTITRHFKTGRKMDQDEACLRSQTKEDRALPRSHSLLNVVGSKIKARPSQPFTGKVTKASVATFERLSPSVESVSLCDMTEVPLLLGDQSFCYQCLYTAYSHWGADIDAEYREKEGNCPDHIIVLRKGHFYRFTVTDDDGNILSAPELQRQLQYIKDTCENKPTIPSVGILTALDRTPWAQARIHLRKLNRHNISIFNDIESSLLILSLEEISADTRQAACEKSLFGNGHGRWFDKCYTLISFENGTFGVNFDHSVMDGICLVNHVSHTTEQIISQDGIWKGSTNVRELPDPQELMFIVDDDITKTISKAEEQYRNDADNVELTIKVTPFDRDVLKTKQIHPDAFMQLALHYTYYKMYNRPAPTYETATTRKFYHGRTETVRTCTIEAIQWCKAMLDDNIKPSDRLQLFKKASDKQMQLMNECVNNDGCDRHLLGLQLIASESKIPLPELYKDPSYIKSGGNGNFILSTSLTGYL
ncbi:peroxisomal carnitine O-octanoyltransferase-like, partial [Saccoglossus kowalevskii]